MVGEPLLRVEPAACGSDRAVAVGHREIEHAAVHQSKRQFRPLAMESSEVQNVVWRDSAFHVERSWYGLIFSLREVLVNGKVIVNTPERRVPFKHVAIADGLLNQPLHNFEPSLESGLRSFQRLSIRRMVCGFAAV